MKFLLPLLPLLVLTAGAFTTHLQRKPDGLWLTISNAPASWAAEWSTDLQTWHHWARWEAQDGMASCELRLGTNAQQFWRVKALP